MRFLSLTLALFLLVACNNKDGKPDVSDIKVEVQLQRFDRDFFSIDTTHLETSLDRLYKKYPSFLPLYFEYLSPINFIVHRDGKSYSQAILEYFRNMKSLADTVQKKFNDAGDIAKKLEQNLRYVKYYYPSF